MLISDSSRNKHKQTMEKIKPGAVIKIMMKTYLVLGLPQVVIQMYSSNDLEARCWIDLYNLNQNCKMRYGWSSYSVDRSECHERVLHNLTQDVVIVAETPDDQPEYSDYDNFIE